MKKSISVNISGLLFNIEEDAYERLKRYLDEVKLYFSSYDASGEIVADIESRMAEIFSTKVGPHKQVLTIADVEAIIAQMGNIQDFAAIEEPLEEPRVKNGRPYEAYESYTSYETETKTGGEPTTGRKLYRDESRKMIGGVAAGFAHYLRLDPTWIRLALVGFVAFDIFITLAISSSALFLAYIILWMVLPANKDLVPVEDKKSKKLYRNPDEKVIGGVAGGLGAFFGVDTVMIRILFVVMFVVGGSGLLAYIILWICMPMAHTLTQRMQMKGEPVTLANIEHQVKKNLDLKEGEEESVLARILLFPFRLLSAIFSKGSAGAQVLVQFIGDMIRVVVGFVLSTSGFITLLAMFIAIGVYIGLDSDRYLQLSKLDVPLELLRNTIPSYLMIAGVLVAAIPVYYIMLLGIALLSRRWLMPSSGSWIMAGLWVMAIIVTSAMVPRYVLDYKTHDYVDREALIFNADSSKTLVLRMQKGDWKKLYNVDLNIVGSTNGTLRLEQRVMAHGADSDEAQEHASWATYPVKQQDSIILFSNRLTLPEDKPYYLQHINATLYVPYGQPFKIDYNMKEMLRGNVLSPWGYHSRDIKSNTFVFDKTGKISCITCSEERMEEIRQNQQFEVSTQGGRVLNYKDFDKLSVGSHYQLTVVQGPEYKVEVSGDEEALDDMEVRLEGSSLSFFSENWDKKWWKGNSDKRAAKIYVSIPNLAGLYLSGVSRANVKMEQQEPMILDLSGSTEMQADLDVKELSVDMSGSSELRLNGQCNTFRADVSGASEILAEKFKAASAKVELSGASNASLWVTDRLDADASGGSNLSYRGNPTHRNVDQSSGASIRSRE